MTYCGPPFSVFDDARAAEIAAAGFNVVGPPCETDPAGTMVTLGETLEQQIVHALDVAARQNLRLWVEDPRFDRSALTRPDGAAHLEHAVRAYRGHPALAGYYVADEPVAGDFAALAPVVSALRSGDAAHPAFINLLPDFITPKGLGTNSYAEYIGRFIETVHPALLSYDYYPFGYDQEGNEKDRSTFFTNLTVMREQALRHRLPVMLIMLAMPHANYRDPTAAELRWQAFHALAFGARGLAYFAYWTPVRVGGAEVMRFRHGLIEHGQRTLHYYQAAELNQRLLAMANELASFQSLGVADSEGVVAAPLPLGPIAAIDGGPVTSGLFTNDSGELAVVLVNRDYRHDITVSLRLEPGARLPQLFGDTAARWQPMASGEIQLAAGDARLLRWQRAARLP